jgi:glutathione S-transferase
MKIYDMKGFPNPARVRIALAEKGLTDTVEFTAVDVFAGQHLLPAFEAKNPTRRIPVLELDDGTCIAECTAITEYLDHARGEPTLTGTTPKERGVIGMMQRRAEDRLFDPIATYFHQATEGLGPKLESYQNKDWGLRNRDIAQATIRQFDAVLATRPYLAGDSFTVADITAFAALNYADFAKVEIPAGLGHLAEWRARVAARPSIALG